MDYPIFYLPTFIDRGHYQPSLFRNYIQDYIKGETEPVSIQKMSEADDEGLSEVVHDIAIGGVAGSTVSCTGSTLGTAVCRTAGHQTSADGMVSNYNQVSMVVVLKGERR